MTKIEITSPIRNFGKLAGVSADRENGIDFLHDHEAAILCTSAYCANELRKYLTLTDARSECVFTDQPSGKNAAIVLDCTGDRRDDGAFSFLVPRKSELVIRAASRNGLVNGTYEFLRLQGWCWLEPGPEGEFAPERHAVIFPERNQDYNPSFHYRAFYFEYSSQASIDFLTWMARNRMNVYGNFPELRPIAQKLGMYLIAGGHVISEIMKPGRLMLSGKTLLEEYPEWYGVRKDGKAVTAENAQDTQFCCSNPELMDYLAGDLVERLNHQWLGTDILGVSGFDTWGSTCQCEKCRNFSDSDKYLLFMSALRERFDKAYRQGTLIHNPMLNVSAYEGTATIHAPTHIPECMAKAHDNCVVYVINRCYEHPMSDASECPQNAEYAKIFQNWSAFRQQLTLWGGEYYNVSRHEDLPLLFAHNMAASMQFYYNVGARGITYMHTPVINWGVRGITQGLHAALGWNVNLDVAAFCRKFITLRFGKYAPSATLAYQEIEKASRFVAEWRSWGESILTKLTRCVASDGKTEAPLASYHAKDNDDAIRRGCQVAAHYRKAARLLDAIWDSVNAEYRPVAQSAAVNPGEIAKARAALRQFHFIECDLRLLHYGIDVITLMTGCAEAYDALQRKDWDKLDLLRQKLEKQAKRMSFVTESVNYRAYVPHFETRSRLERSQCGPFIRMLKKIHPRHLSLSISNESHANAKSTPED